MVLSVPSTRLLQLEFLKVCSIGFESYTDTLNMKYGPRPLVYSWMEVIDIFREDELAFFGEVWEPEDTKLCH